jgi:hypothetical protein
MTPRHHALETALGLALALSAVAPAAASARFDNNPVYVPGVASTHVAATPAVRIVRIREGGSFNWADAAIGAAAGLGLAALAAAGSAAVTRRESGPSGRGPKGQVS